MPRMPSTLRSRHRLPSRTLRHGRSLGALAVLACVGLGLTACSDDDPTAGADTTTSPAASVAAITTPSETGAVSQSAAWARHRPVPAGFTRLASAKLSIGVPDGFEAINDPQRLGTTDLAARNSQGSVIAARDRAISTAADSV